MNNLPPARKGSRGEGPRSVLRRRRDIETAVVALFAFAAVGPLSVLFMYASSGSTDPWDYGWAPLVDEIENVTKEDVQAQAEAEAEVLPVPVYVFPPTHPIERAGEVKHFLWDGVKRSKKLRRSVDPDEDGVVWLVDVVRFKCEPLISEVKASICRRIAGSARVRLNATGVDAVAPEFGDGGNCTTSRFDQKAVDLQFYRSHRAHVDPAWRVIMVDYNDEGYVNAINCAEKLSALLGGVKYVQFATRKQVEGRLVKHVGRKESDLFHKQGSPISWAAHKGVRHLGGMPRALRYGIRSDQVDHYEEFLNGTFPFDHGSLDPPPGVSMSNVLDLPSLPRDNDVGFFWNYGTDREHGTHRDAVARTLQNLAETNQTLKIHVGTVGVRAQRGRNSVQSMYAKELLLYKISVVCQRDRWEGHYRLMEALLGGGMVMTDPMHPLPVFIEDRQSVVVYNSLLDLREKILFYLDHPGERLEIARRGHEVVMTHHRSWHGVERLIFGNWSNVQGVR